MTSVLARSVAHLGRAVAEAAAVERDAFALAPAAPLPAHTEADDCPGCAARCQTPETHRYGCGCAPHGPHAARAVAEHIAATGRHAHLVADGETVCLSGADCPTIPILDGVRPR